MIFEQFIDIVSVDKNSFFFTFVYIDESKIIKKIYFLVINFLQMLKMGLEFGISVHIPY